MKTEIRYCKHCRKETRHDVYKDGLQNGVKQPTSERIFFGIFTFGIAELLTDKWRQCQVCDRKVQIT